MKGKPKTLLSVRCNANHEPTLMISVLSNAPLEERNIGLWCPTCDRTCILEIDSAQIITNYED